MSTLTTLHSSVLSQLLFGCLLTSHTLTIYETDRCVKFYRGSDLARSASRALWRWEERRSESLRVGVHLLRTRSPDPMEFVMRSVPLPNVPSFSLQTAEQQSRPLIGQWQ